MTEKFTQKNTKLSLEFDRYLSNKPSFYAHIPNKGTIVFTVKGDNAFNKHSYSMLRKSNLRNKIVEVQREAPGKWRILTPINETASN